MVWYFLPGLKYHTIYIYIEMNSEEERTAHARTDEGGRQSAPEIGRSTIA